jgi:hypothetical protein
MTWFEVYALFGMPVIAVLIGLGALYFASRNRHPQPGE